MTKKALITWTIVLLFLFPGSQSLKLQAQNPPSRAVGVSCNNGHYYNAPCDGSADCDRVWKEHLCSAHNDCNGDDSGGSSRGKVGASSLVGSFFQGALLGGLGGSLLKDGCGELQWGTGAVLGSGTFVLLSLAAKGKNTSPGKRAVGIVLGGALLGAGVAMAEKAMGDSCSAFDSKKIAIRAAEGIGVILVPMVLFGGFNSKAQKYSSYRRGKIDFFSSTAISISRRRIGLKIIL